MAIEVSKLNLDCQKCTKEQKKWRGCEGGAKQPYIIDGEEIDFCPIKLIHPMTYRYLTLYNYYKQKLPLFEPTILHYPAKLLDIFRIVDIEFAKMNRSK